MKLSNKAYDIIKWIVWIVLPAVTTFLGVVLPLFDYPHTDTLLTILSAVTALIGTITGVSNRNYNKDIAEEPDAETDIIE